MDDKEILIHHIMELDVSAIELLAKTVRTDDDGTRILIDELVEEGRLEGYITEDGRRFFKTRVQVSDKPRIQSEEKLPDFMTYNAAPGRIVAAIGAIMGIIGGAFLVLSGGIIYYENFGLAMLLFGVVIMLSGCFWIGRRETP